MSAAVYWPVRLAGRSYSQYSVYYFEAVNLTPVRMYGHTYEAAQLRNLNMIAI